MVRIERFGHMMTQMSFAICAAAITSLCACSATAPRSALKRFPIGIYHGLADIGHLKIFRKNGFDTVVAYPLDPQQLPAIAHEARKQGLKLLVFAEHVRRNGITGSEKWPLDAWYLSDEPEVNRVSAKELEELSRRIRIWDPNRPQTFVVGIGRAAADYGHIGDALLLDWYPVPHLLLDSVADQIDTAYSHLPPGKPLWMVIQAFDWKDDPPRGPRSRKRVGRFPTHHEIRFMTYLAILHNAKGIFFYRFNSKEIGMGENLFHKPERWDAVSRVARELKRLQKVFAQGIRIPLPFPPDPDGIEAGCWSYSGWDYLILANRKKGLYMSFPEILLSGGWEPLFEHGLGLKDTLKPVGRNWNLAPYRVIVLRRRKRQRKL